MGQMIGEGFGIHIAFAEALALINGTQLPDHEQDEPLDVLR